MPDAGLWQQQLVFGFSAQNENTHGFLKFYVRQANKCLLFYVISLEVVNSDSPLWKKLILIQHIMVYNYLVADGVIDISNAEHKASQKIGVLEMSPLWFGYNCTVQSRLQFKD